MYIRVLLLASNDVCFSVAFINWLSLQLLLSLVVQLVLCYHAWMITSAKLVMCFTR